MCLLTFIVVDIDSLFVTPFYTLPQHPPQQIRHALGGLDGGDHEEVGVHVGEVYVVSGVADELGQESSLGSAVTLSKRVQGVGSAVEVHYFFNKLVMGQVLGVVALSEPMKDALRLVLNVFRGAELRALFADVHRADLAGPVIKVREKKVVDGLIMGKVKCFCFWGNQPFRISGGGEHTLNLIQFAFVPDIELVYQDGRSRVTI